MGNEDANAQDTRRIEAKQCVLETLIGIRGMAEIEALRSPAWERSLKLIDNAIVDLRTL